jgi:hypothetical protein
MAGRGVVRCGQSGVAELHPVGITGALLTLHRLWISEKSRSRASSFKKPVRREARVSGYVGTATDLVSQASCSAPGVAALVPGHRRQQWTIRINQLHAAMAFGP